MMKKKNIVEAVSTWSARPLVADAAPGSVRVDSAVLATYVERDRSANTSTQRGPSGET